MMDDGKRGWAVGDGGTILVTQDGGESWREQGSGTTVSLHAIEMLPNGKSGWVVGQGATILVTEDGGQHWSQVRNLQWPAPWFLLLCAVMALALIEILRRARYS
jgi:photosystem II stability/assembly factor-like uncharacterized protein